MTGLAQRVPDLEDGYSGAYTFALPASWESGKIKLQAQLLPTQSGSIPPLRARATAHAAALPGVPQPWAPCTSSACLTDDQFAISQIPFLYTFSATIRPVAMIATNPYDATLPDPDTVFQWARVVTPVPLVVEPYASTIDIGSEIGKNNDDGSVTVALMNDMRNYVCHHGSPDHGWDVGVEHNGIRTAQSNSYCIDYLPPGTTPVSFAIANSPQPLTSVAHELFHLFGRPHASACNGANIGVGGGTVPAESWPPDQLGYLQSVGLAYNPTGNSLTYQVIHSTSWYDFMSYCDSSGPGDPLASPHNAWISVHNWNAILSSFGYSAARDASAARPRARAAAKVVPSLQVSASVDRAGHVTIIAVDPTTAPSQPRSASPYHLVATDSAGRARIDVPMLAASGHIDSRPAQPTLLLEAVVPAAAVAGVDVVANGTMLATRRKSAHPPTVTIPRLPTFHAGNATVRWRAADRDRDALVVDVDYSGDGGRTWNQVWMGPNVSSARLPDRYLFRSTRARIRVVVNDGFQTATAVSRPFSAPGAPPSVRIITPEPGLRQPNDAPLVLSAQVFDDQARLITGRRLRWMLGRRLLGTGARITVSGLPAGTRRIELIARDRSGRTGASSVLVALRATRPLFLTLRVPRKLGPTARSLRLTVSSSLEATLVVPVAGLRPQRFTVGRGARHPTVRVLRGHGRLSLRLSLGAGRLTRTMVISVPR